MRSVRLLRMIIVDQFPVPVPPGCEITAPVLVREMAKELILGTLRILPPAQDWLEGPPVTGVVRRDRGSSDGTDQGGINIHDGPHPGRDDPAPDRETLLPWVFLVRTGPCDDAGDPGATFEFRSFLAPQRSRRGNVLRIAQGGVGAVVAQEDDERILRDLEQ